MTRRMQGFSLIEMAFVLIIVTLLLGGLLVPFATQVEQRRIAETNKTMEEIREALIGYALSHRSTNPFPALVQPHLPCPDTDNDEREDRSGAGVCDDDEGNLPWETLGLGSQDAWGNRFHYRVTPDFSASAAGFSLFTQGDTNICSADPGAGVCPPNTRVATEVPAVIVSYGKNGYGARNFNNAGVRNPAPPVANADERVNQALPFAQFHTTFISRNLTLPGAGNSEFDDQVVWLSSNVLFNRMVAAGRLP